VGGLGSGRGRLRWGARATVDDYLCLDIRRLHRERSLQSGPVVLSWWRDGTKVASIQVWPIGNQVVLSYRWRGAGGPWESVEEAVSLTWTPCTFGGQRAWFVCPGVVNGVGCLRRCAVLYSGGKYFACRRCYSLAYESQRENASDRALRRTQLIRQRLGGSGGLEEPFPARPRYMHRRTYRRFIQRADLAYRQSWAALAPWLAKVEHRLLHSGAST